jgi:hypothetical protein
MTIAEINRKDFVFMADNIRSNEEAPSCLTKVILL